MIDITAKTYNIFDILKSTQIFSELDVQVMNKILASSELIQYQPGDIVVKEGDEGDSLFIIIDGSVNVTKRIKSQEHIVAVLNEGEEFGEISLLINQPRTATVISSKKSELLKISRKELGPIMKEHSSLLVCLNKIMGSRISILEDDEHQKYKFRPDYRPDLDPSILETILQLNDAIGGEPQTAHCKETAMLTREIAKLLCPMLSLPLFFAGYMHEIGKIGIPLELIEKERKDPKSLTMSEKYYFKDVFKASVEILKPDPNLYSIVHFVEYLDKNSFLEMPIETQILMIADDYLMAVSSNYQNIPESEAVLNIKEQSGKRYNSKIVTAFETVIEKFQSLKAEKQLEFLKQMNIALDFKDHYTLSHSIHTRDTSLKIGRYINGKYLHGKLINLTEKDMNLLAHSCELHDVGKIQVPTEILIAPRKLTTSEMEIMMKHPDESSKFFKDIPGMDILTKAVRHHHEKFDGSGYPDGLIGEDIPLMSRIMAIADVYSALTTERAYRLDENGEKMGFSSPKALEIMETMEGHFDLELLTIFKKIIAE